MTLETRVTDNETKITAFKELRTSLNALQASIEGLRGAISLGDTNNTFASKQAFSSTSRTDGVLPSVAGSLVGVSVTNNAAPGAHNVEIRRVASAQKISSSSFTSKTA